MRIYEPRQKHVDGKPVGWHFIVYSDEEGWAHPVGYCTEHNPHATSEEAVECYRRWELDNAKFRIDHPDEKRKCEVCSAWTSLSAHPGGELGWGGERWLCEEHNNRDGLSMARKPQGGA